MMLMMMILDETQRVFLSFFQSYPQISTGVRAIHIVSDTFQPFIYDRINCSKLSCSVVLWTSLPDIFCFSSQNAYSFEVSDRTS